MKWHRANRERHGFVVVHVLDVSVCVEKVISLPTRGKRRQCGLTKFQVDVFAAAKDHESVVLRGDKRGDVSVVCIGAALTCKGPGGARLIVVVGQVPRSLAINLFRISAKRE